MKYQDKLSYHSCLLEDNRLVKKILPLPSVYFLNSSRALSRKKSIFFQGMKVMRCEQKTYQWRREALAQKQFYMYKMHVVSVRTNSIVSNL